MYGMAKKLDDLKAEIDMLDQILRTMRKHPHHIHIKVLDPHNCTYDQLPLAEFTEHFTSLHETLIRHLATKVTRQVTLYNGIRLELKARADQSAKMQVVHRNAPRSFNPDAEA